MHVKLSRCALFCEWLCLLIRNARVSIETVSSGPKDGITQKDNSLNLNVIKVATIIVVIICAVVIKEVISILFLLCILL